MAAGTVLSRVQTRSCQLGAEAGPCSMLTVQGNKQKPVVMANCVGRMWSQSSIVYPAALMPLSVGQCGRVPGPVITWREEKALTDPAEL